MTGFRRNNGNSFYLSTRNPRKTKPGVNGKTGMKEGKRRLCVLLHKRSSRCYLVPNEQEGRKHGVGSDKTKSSWTSKGQVGNTVR